MSSKLSRREFLKGAAFGAAGLAAAGVLEGFHVRGFGAALLGSLMYSALGLLIESALGGLFPKA